MLITHLLLAIEVRNVKPMYRKLWAANVTLDLSLKVKQGYPNLKALITRLLLVLEVCNVKPTYRKSWTVNLLMWLDLTLSPSFKGK